MLDYRVVGLERFHCTCRTIVMVYLLCNFQEHLFNELSI